MMRKTIIVMLCWFGGLTAGAQTLPKGLYVESGIPAGGYKVRVTELADYIAQSDHPLIVSFWATFCVPCLKEMPYFQSAVGRYKDKRVELILVSLDLPDSYPAKIAASAKKNDLTARIFWLNETDADYFCPRVDTAWSGGIPCSLFINNATHYRRFFDRQLTEAQVEPAIREMVASQK